MLSRDEFLDLFLDDLELPDLAKQRAHGRRRRSRLRRAGYSVTGSPANLALARTMRNSLSRRIALQRPKLDETARRCEDEIAELEAQAGDDEDELALLRAELRAARAAHAS